MLKNGNQVTWDEKSIYSFERIKQSIMEALVLITLDYVKDFIIFPFASEHTMVAVLL